MTEEVSFSLFYKWWQQTFFLVNLSFYFLKNSLTDINQSSSI